MLFNEIICDNIKYAKELQASDEYIGLKTYLPVKI